MANPLVSILMPAYNCEPYVGIAISSILKQSYSNFELIICDDGSTDQTWSVINSFSDQRIQIFRNQNNLGYLETYNFLMTKVQGEYFTFQDADDWSIPSRLEIQLKIFDQFADVDVCACNGSFYYTEQTQRPCPSFKSDYIQVTEEHFQFMLPSVMYKRKVLFSINKFNSFFDKTTGGDQYFILEVLSNFKGYAVNEYLYVARFNHRSNHRTFTSKKKMAAPDLYFLLKSQRVKTGSDWLLEGRQDLLLAFESKLLSNRKFLAEKYREYAVYKIDAGQLLPGVKFIAQAMICWPFHGSTLRTIMYAFRKAFHLA